MKSKEEKLQRIKNKRTKNKKIGLQRTACEKELVKSVEWIPPREVIARNENTMKKRRAQLLPKLKEIDSVLKVNNKLYLNDGDRP